MYLKTYWHDNGDEYTSCWHNYYIKELKSFLCNVELKNKTIIEYGCYKGHTIDWMQERYPTCQVIGVDFFNISNHNCIIETDIRSFKNSYSNLFLAINDLIDYTKDLESKLAGRKHALDNLVCGGYYFETSANPVREIAGLDLIKSSEYISFFQKRC